MRHTRALRLSLAMAGGFVLLPASDVSAASLDLTGGTTITACVNAGGALINFNSVSYCSFAGALWTTSDGQTTGSGVIDSFVRISGANQDAVSGMNTDARPLTQDENSSPTFTHDITEGIVPIVNISGTNYYEFLLDINQNGDEPFLTLKAIELCHSVTGSQSIASGATSCPGTSFYSLGANEIQLDASDNAGSGSGDLFAYIPVGAGIPDANFIYLWSQFGPAPNPNNGGFEEWAIRTASPISPAPDSGNTLSLLGLAMLGAGYLRRRALGSRL